MIYFAIDIGSSTTTIYEKGRGLVLKESTLIAIEETKNGEMIKAVGDEAKELMQFPIANVKIYSPIKEAEIKSRDKLTALVRAFFEKVIGSGAVGGNSVKGSGTKASKGAKKASKSAVSKAQSSTLGAKFAVICCVPTGASEKDKATYFHSLKEAGADEVHLLPHSLALANYLNLLHSHVPCFAISMGHGATDFAIIGNVLKDVYDRGRKEILTGCTINIGGSLLNASLTNYVAEHNFFEISSRTADIARQEIGTLQQNDQSSLIINGRNLLTSRSDEMRLNSLLIREAITPYFLQICTVIDTMLKFVDKKTEEWLAQTGIYLAGGLSQTHGLDIFIKHHLGLNIKLADDPLNAVVIGAGRLWDSKEHFDATVALSD
ncbi:MAG: rod shape-determining protein [Firmicutes bacterium]|nr:rod shape-determining protein [Bacillota bacterium]